MTVAAPARSKWRSGVLLARVRHPFQGGGDDHDADRHVDEEDPFPGEAFDQEAAEQQADRAAAGRDPGPDRERFGPRGTLAEGGGDDRERGGREHRATESLDRAADDQLRLRGGEAVGQRGDREEGDAGEEQRAAPEQVGGAPAEQQEAAEEQRVGVDHPGQRAVGEAEVVLDGGQGHVHDRRVEDDHELAEADDDQGQPRIEVGVSAPFHAEHRSTKRSGRSAQAEHRLRTTVTQGAPARCGPAEAKARMPPR